MTRDLRKLASASLENVNLPVPFNNPQYVSLADWNGDANADCAQDLLRAVARLSQRSCLASESRRRKWVVLVATCAYEDRAAFPSLPDTCGVTEALAKALAGAEGSSFECTARFGKGRSEVRRSAASSNAVRKPEYYMAKYLPRER